MEHLKISRFVKIAIVLILCAAMMFMCVSPGFAVVGTASVVASAVVAAMTAFGVGTLVSGMSASQVTDWITSELNSWASSLSNTVANLLPVASIAVNPLGALTLMPATAAKIVTFVRWLTNKYNVTPGGSSVNVVSVSFASNQPFRNPSPSTQYLKFGLVQITSSYQLQLFPENNWYYYAFVSGRNSGSVYVTVVTPEDHHLSTPRYYNQQYQGSGHFGDGTYNTGYNLTFWTQSFGYPSGTALIPEYSSVNEGLSVLASFLGNGPKTINLVPEGAIDYPDYVGDDEEEQPYVLDWGGSPGMTVDEAAGEIMDRVAANELASNGSIAIDPEDAQWPDLLSPQAVPSLDQIFPFCIPFDVYHFFQALTATPTAPRWEVPFVVPGLVNYTFVIDLTQFNTVAQIFRTMELLCFCVGLALATRKLIRG